MSYKNIKIILQGLLLAVIAIIPFIKIGTLYFPFISGKIYFFRFLVSLAFFFWIWLILKDRKNGLTWQEILMPFKNILVIAIILFLLSQIFISFFVISPEIAFFSTIERQDGVIQYGFLVLYFLMLAYAFREKKDWKILISIFVATALAVSGYAWLNSASQSRLEGVFGNPSYLAAYLIFAIGFCFILLERKFFSAKGETSSIGGENKFVNIILWLSTLFFAITIIFTQTRGVYLGLAGAIFLFCLLSVIFLRKQNKKLAISCAIILAIGVVSIAGLFLAKDTNFVKNNSMLSRVTEITQFWEIGSIRERVLTWQIAVKAFQEKPILGYGLGNFMTAFNKYYDSRIGKGEPWFDHTHNQLLEYLATGGIVLISFYIFFLVAVIYIIFKISKKSKLLSFILAGTYLAYIIQGLFLFDILSVYLGLFPFLAFIVFEYKEDNIINLNKRNLRDIKLYKPALIVAGLLSIFGIYTTVMQPYSANASAIQFLAGTSQGYYKEALPFAKKTFEINNPYTYWELRKRLGWQFLFTIDEDNKFTEEQVKSFGEIYDVVIPELERFVQKRPFDPQIYYILSKIYRIGYEKLGKDDLQKAFVLLEQSFNYSDLRVEYYNEMARVLLIQGKFDEGEKLLKDYLKRVKSFEYFPHLIIGHYYYVAGKYDLAMENYKKAKAENYTFLDDDGEYSRYIDSAQNTKNYQEIVDLSLEYIKKEHIENRTPSADIYFNVALGYYYLADAEKAREFFLKTLELNKEEYQQYGSFFGL